MSEESAAKPTCFVIMPISDQIGYENGHFTAVYNDIITPACQNAGFLPLRADETTQCNLIQEDILRQLIDAPMAICDLSSQNPNVLFELGIRQAFNLPVVIIKDSRTESIFDIAMLRYIQYDENMGYRSVLNDVGALATSIRSTFESHRSGQGVNSVIGLIDANKRSSRIEEKETIPDQGMLELIYEEVKKLQSSSSCEELDDEVERRKNSLISGCGEEVIPKPVRSMIFYNPYAAAYAAKVDLVITLQLILEDYGVPYDPSADREEMVDLVVDEGILDQSWKNTVNSIFDIINSTRSQKLDTCLWGTMWKGIHLLYRIINILVREKLPNNKPGAFPWF